MKLSRCNCRQKMYMQIFLFFISMLSIFIVYDEDLRATSDHIIHVQQPNDLEVEPLFFVDDPHNVSVKFYLMTLDEIVNITKNPIYKQAALQCRTLLGSELIQSLMAHPNRVYDKRQADLIVFEFGNEQETNYPVYGHPERAYLHHDLDTTYCDSNSRAKFTALFVSFFNSALPQTQIFDKHPNIKFAVIMDLTLRGIQPKPWIRIKTVQFNKRFIFFGLDSFAQERQKAKVISFPPPLMPRAEHYKSHHSMTNVTSSAYSIVFQGQASAQVRIREKFRDLTTGNDAIPYDDVYIYFTSGLGRRDTKKDMYHLLANTKFAFDLPGDRLWSYRFTEALYLNAIPVRVNEYDQAWKMPFHQIINWKQIALIYDESILENPTIFWSEIDKIRNIELAQVVQMKRKLDIAYDTCFKTPNAKIDCLLSAAQYEYF